MKKAKLFFIFNLFLYTALLGQQTEQDTSKIEIINANQIYHTAEMHSGVNVLLGEVELYHDSTTMYCDSAILNQSLKKFDAFGNVHIERLQIDGDTVQLWGDTLYYDGIKKFAKIRKNVILKNDTATLTTDSLNYDMKKNLGYYFNGGTTINSRDTLKSFFGYFYADSNFVLFKKDVEIRNPRFKIYTDTMKYDLEHEKSYFYGPTEIISDSNYIYTEYGEYDHKANIGILSHKPFLHSGEHDMQADSIIYDRNKGVGEAFYNVKITDTVNDVILTGEYGIFYEQNQYSLITDSALFVQIYDNDTLWLHGDTLISYIDTAYEDIDTAIYRLVFAYYHVKIFRKDFQAKCDSMFFTARDSMLMMFKNPVIWTDSAQIYANKFQLYIYNNNLDELILYDSVYFAQEVDSTVFNQVKCDYSRLIFKKKDLDKMQTISDVKVIYFIQDKKNIVSVVNLQTDTMWIYFDSNKVSLIKPQGKAQGQLLPPNQASGDKKQLPGFIWLDYLRPKKPEDIFLWP